VRVGHGVAVFERELVAIQHGMVVVGLGGHHARHGGRSSEAKPWNVRSPFGNQRRDRQVQYQGTVQMKCVNIIF